MGANPSRGGQREQYDGLTAQALFVLSREQGILEFAYLRNDSTFGIARRDFLNNKKLVALSIEKITATFPTPIFDSSQVNLWRRDQPSCGFPGRCWN